MTLLSSDANESSLDFDSSPAIAQKLGQQLNAEQVFYRLLEAIERQIANQNQAFTLTLAGENSQFVRFSQARVRQTGEVRDGQMYLSLMSAETGAERMVAARLPFTAHFETDWFELRQALDVLQADLPQVPVDPYLVLPGATQSNRSREVRLGHLLSSKAVADTLLLPVQELDFSGLYAGGTAYRAYGDSAGNRHWFETPSFTLDYSLFGDRQNQAVKGTLAGNRWSQAEYQQNIHYSQRQFDLLKRPAKSVAKGAYRTYLAPAAAADIIDTIVWGGGLGEADLQQGNSAFSQLESGAARLSKQFSLSENFHRVDVPRFNESGVLAPAQLAVIEAGKWANSLVSDRSAKEYGKASNAANQAESMRAPVVAPGTLATEQVLAQLDTGLYVSNLHYLNWSDRAAGRMTGMTRYACFWVESGEMVAPIENLRFDDTLYRFLGKGLVNLTDQASFVPAVDTYDRRSLGGIWTPGMLIDEFRYTL